MSDQDGPASGSRWESATGVALVLAGGIGGFAIGHAAAGNAGSAGAVSDRNGVLDQGVGGRPDFGDRPGRDGFRPDGAAPDGAAPDGTAPGGAGHGVTPPDTGSGTA